MDQVKLPIVPHYSRHPVAECKDIAQEFSYNVGTAIAYLWRADFKHDDPLDDLRKARDHLTFEIDRLEKRNAKTLSSGGLPGTKSRHPSDL